MALTPSQRAGLSTATGQIRSGTTPIRFPNGGGAGTPQERYNRYRQNNNANFLSFPPDSPDIRLILVARDYGIGTPANILLRGQQGTMIQGFVLPLPQMNLVDRYQINYDENVGMLDGLIGAGRRFLENLGGSVGGSFITGAARDVGALAGLSLNKFKSVLMEAPILKTHEFVWKLGPKTPAESQTIRNIVNQLKRCMAPELVAAGTVLAFPYIFDIYYDPNAANMYAFKPCVLRSIEINYGDSAGQPSFFRDGLHPEHVVITASFIEIEMWTREDYESFNQNSNLPSFNPVDSVRPIGGGGPVFGASTGGGGQT